MISVSEIQMPLFGTLFGLGVLLGQGEWDLDLKIVETIRKTYNKLFLLYCGLKSNWVKFQVSLLLVCCL